MRRTGVLAALLAFLLALTGAAPALAAAPRVSYTQSQQQFMCTICHEPLNEAHSDEAMQEDAYLRGLIAHGDTLAQIKHEMVVQYGVGVLAVPPAHGFALLVFVIPGAVIVLGLAILAYTIPRWRRRSAAQGARSPAHAGPLISDEDARRLDADLARRP